ncbi:hypothetical protein SS05631_c02620 [Sinorhizobium sp. CCBAU 05631]|nr:hypothetical protein SS05631_c02620 [Sinorhizobium sp. CCBAU 05631]
MLGVDGSIHEADRNCAAASARSIVSRGPADDAARQAVPPRAMLGAPFRAEVMVEVDAGLWRKGLRPRSRSVQGHPRGDAKLDDFAIEHRHRAAVDDLEARFGQLRELSRAETETDDLIRCSCRHGGCGSRRAPGDVSAWEEAAEREQAPAAVPPCTGPVGSGAPRSAASLIVVIVIVGQGRFGSEDFQRRFAAGNHGVAREEGDCRKGHDQNVSQRGRHLRISILLEARECISWTDGRVPVD